MATRTANGALPVTGLGIVSPVGFGAAASCAAARAGISRLGELEGLRVSDPASGKLEKATGHAIRGYTDGFSGLGRLVRLGVGALGDLLQSQGALDWRRTGLFLTLSSGYYRTERERLELGDGPAGESAAARRELLARRLIPTLARHWKLTIPPANQHVVFGDATGILTLLQRAATELAAGRLRQVVVGGIDSSVEPEMLRTLHQFGVLKTPANPTGFLPGEAAAMILLEAPGTPAVGAGARCGLAALAEAREPHARLADEPALGRALASAMTASLTQLPGRGADTRLLVGGLNGDRYRAYDYGHALVRLRGTSLPPDGAQWYPALAFGETGAAAGPLAVAMAVAGIRRGYARSREALVWLTDDTGARGALAVRHLEN